MADKEPLSDEEFAELIGTCDETMLYLIIDQLSYLLGEPERNDVVVMRWPKDEDIYFIKRIIGLPGETVELHGTHIVIQRGIGIEPLKLEQPYLGEAPRAEYNTYTLGEGEYFVMGDNRDNSSDSRVWGALPRRDIIGRAFVRLFPFTSIEFKPGSIISTNAE